MQTKPCEGVLRIDLTATDPIPELYLVYDGLAGIDARPMLRDILGSLEEKNPAELKRFVEAIRRRRSARCAVYFHDYVSYGIGGGDATSEYYKRTHLILYNPARPAEGTFPAVPEHLAVARPDGRWERLSLEGVIP
jgi:hypothetical protein